MSRRISAIRLRQRRDPLAKFLSPFQEFAKFEASGGLLLIAASVAAMIVANSTYSGAYLHLLHTDFSMRFGTLCVSKPLHLWVNDGLMAIFFLHVGLEIKREIVTGELASIRKVALPLFAAIGGMLFPVLIYIALNYNSEALSGWAIPVATDIAFALGILSLLGKRVPISLKILLAAFAIFDDIGAIIIIAIFYSSSISWIALGTGCVLLGLLFLIGRAGVKKLAIFMVVGFVVWLVFMESGVHATIAGVLLALAIPCRPRIKPGEVKEVTRDILEEYSAALKEKDEERRKLALVAFEALGREARSPLARLEHILNQYVNFVILPLFAFVNAGVALSGKTLADIANPVGFGIIGGLLLGKMLGIFSFCIAAMKLKLAEMPADLTRSHLFGMSLLGGMGFTMSLFINGLSFDCTEHLDQAKLAILSGSLLAGIAGYSYLRFFTKAKTIPAI